MSLQLKIKKDLTEALLNKDESTKSILRVLVGEFDRQPKKELSDSEVIKIIKKLVMNAEECYKYKHDVPGVEDNTYIQALNHYLPQKATEEEIIGWIKNNIDFSKFKNKMAAMKPIMDNFQGRVDGSKVKEILQSTFS